MNEIQGSTHLPSRISICNLPSRFSLRHPANFDCVHASPRRLIRLVSPGSDNPAPAYCYNDHRTAKSKLAFRHAALRRSKTARLFWYCFIAIKINRGVNRFRRPMIIITSVTMVNKPLPKASYILFRVISYHFAQTFLSFPASYILFDISSCEKTELFSSCRPLSAIM